MSIPHHAYQIARLAESGHLSSREYTLLRFLVLRGIPVTDGVSVSQLLRFGGPSAGSSALASHCQAIAEQEAFRRFSTVFEHISDGDVKLASRHERNELGFLNDSSLTYGEIVFSTFVSTMRKVFQIWKEGPSSEKRVTSSIVGPVFVDLGSGAGRAVCAAAILFDFSRCVGIELLEGLHAISEEAVRRLCKIQNEEELTISSALTTFEEVVKAIKPALALPSVEMIRASFFISSPPADMYFEDEVNGAASTFQESDRCPFDWAAQGDVIFANSTCFTSRTLAALALEVPRMKNGTILVTFTRRIDHPSLILLSTEKHDQSWGSATVYICQVNHLSVSTSISSPSSSSLKSPLTPPPTTTTTTTTTTTATTSSLSSPLRHNIPVTLCISSTNIDDFETNEEDNGNSTPLPSSKSAERFTHTLPPSVSIAKNKTSISTLSRVSPSFSRVSPPNHNGYADTYDENFNVNNQHINIKNDNMNFLLSRKIRSVHKGDFIPDDFDIWRPDIPFLIPSPKSLRIRIRESTDSPTTRPLPSPSSPQGQALRFLKTRHGSASKDDVIINKEEENEEVFRPLSGQPTFKESARIISTDLLDETSGDDFISSSPQIDNSDQSPDVSEGDGGINVVCNNPTTFRKRAQSAESTVGEASADLTQILQGFAASQGNRTRNETLGNEDTKDATEELLSSIMAGTPSTSILQQRVVSSSSGDDLRKFVLTRNTATPPRGQAFGVDNSSSPFGDALLRMRSRDSPQGTALRRAKFSSGKEEQQ
jgi:hypothetical protein